MSRLVEVATFLTPEEALCAQGALRADDCFSLLQNEHHLSVAPSLRVGLGGYRLLVLQEDAAKVRQALAELDAAHSTKLEQRESDDDEAPEIRQHKNWLWLPVALSAGVPFLPSYKRKSALFFQLLVSAPIYLMIALWLLY